MFCFIYLFWIIKRCMLRYIAKHTIIALNLFQVDYWVDFGTLLGFYRENYVILGGRRGGQGGIDNEVTLPTGAPTP